MDEEFGGRGKTEIREKRMVRDKRVKEEKIRVKRNNVKSNRKNNEGLKKKKKKTLKIGGVKRKKENIRK